MSQALARAERRFVLSEESHEAEWDAFVAARCDGTGYHLWRWRHVFERALGHHTDYLIARDEDRVVGVLPLVTMKSHIFGHFMVSLPFVNYGGVLATEASVARALLAEAARVAQCGDLSHVEFRHRVQHFPDLPAKRHKVGMLMDLAPDAGAAWQRLDRKVRNQIRKAEKSGLTAAIGGPELVGDFYRVFARNMRDLGTPVYARDFFEEVLRQFPERTRVFSVTGAGTPIAAAIGYAYGRTLEVPWASSLKASRGLCPNHLLYWTVIQHAIAEGFAVLDFGRSTPDEGTYHFKRQWGARPEPLCWEYRLFSTKHVPDQSPKNPRFRLAVALWKRLPVTVATFIGPRIVRSIP